MAQAKATKNIDSTTEEKIKTAARKVFYEKGFAATRTRDIAEEAGLNLALLNYYFRSKQKLFEIIILETLAEFFKTIYVVLNDAETSLEEKIDIAVSNYIDLLIKEPNIPSFLLGECKNRPEYIAKKVFPNSNFPFDSIFYKQYKDKTKRDDVLQFGLNFSSLIIFPFLLKPTLDSRIGLSDNDFKKTMLERKKLIPAWLKTML